MKLDKIMKQAQQMQSKMAQVQEALAKETVTGQAGGGTAGRAGFFSGIVDRCVLYCLRAVCEDLSDSGDDGRGDAAGAGIVASTAGLHRLWSLPGALSDRFDSA